MKKPKYQIWIRSADGAEKPSKYDAVWKSYEEAQFELSRRNPPPGGEYFVRPLSLPSKDPLGIRKKNRGLIR